MQKGYIQRVVAYLARTHMDSARYLVSSQGNRSGLADIIDLSGSIVREARR